MANQYSAEELNHVTKNEDGQSVIVPEIFAAQIELGWKADKLKAHYGISQTDLKNILSALNLKIRKFHKPKFVIAGFTDPVAKEEVKEESTEEEVEETTEKVEKKSTPKTTEKVKKEKVEKTKKVEEVVETQEDLYKEDVNDAEFVTGEESQVEETTEETDSWDDDDEWV